MDALKQSRGHIKGAITRMFNFAADIPVDTGVEIMEIRLERLEDAWNEFRRSQIEMLQFHAQEGYVDPEPDFEAFETKYITAKAAFLKYIRGKLPARDDSGLDNLARQHATFLEQLEKSNATTTGRKVSSEVELPPFRITPFSGEYREWPEFRDTFLGSIDSKSNLSGSQKLRYLKSFLRDEAAKLLHHVTISDSNYEQAWEKLENRYDKPLYLINAYIESFVKLPSVGGADGLQLRKLVDSADEIIRGLAAIEAEDRNPWLIYLLLNKTDFDTRKAWALHNQCSETSTIRDFLTFLETRASALEESDPKNRLSKAPSRTNNPSTKVKSLVVSKPSCPKCKANHPLFQCEQFISMAVSDRRSFARDQKLCYNCLGTQHTSSRCRVSARCAHCRSRHHTLVHQANSTPLSTKEDTFEPPTEETPSCSQSVSLLSNQIKQSNISSGILPTAIVEVKDSAGNLQPCRVLLDTGSQASFVTNRVVKRLGLKRRHACLSISGISALGAGVTNGVVALSLHSRFDSYQLGVEAYILQTITSVTPASAFAFNIPSSMENLQWADPGFNTPGPIDILLGSEIAWRILRDGHRTDDEGNTIAHNTAFGWVVSGKIPKADITSLHVGLDLDLLLKSFWELEEVHPCSTLLEDRYIADDHFAQTFSRAPDNKYLVELPFRQSEISFGNTLSGALSRLFGLERRFSRNEGLRKEYVNFMKVYEELGHMERIPDNEVEPTSGRVFYLPHHAVVTNKMRVVFDGSFKDNHGLSLNSTLHVGPPLQRNLFNVYMLFRLYRYVFCADIIKMFRQIWVKTKDRDLQRIVWRESVDDPMSHFRLSTVTYGTVSAPFLAIRVLLQLSEDYEHQFPEAAKVIKQNSYVDDFAAGSDSLAGVLDLKEQLVGLLECGGLQLSKWVSNCPAIIGAKEGDQTVSLNSESSGWTKVLGLVWDPQQDFFSYKIALEHHSEPTKSNLLSEISKIFDPMGFLAPSTILLKILFQELWLDSVGWKDPLPLKIANKWNLYRQDLSSFEELRIPRRYTADGKHFDLVGFSDASEKAYSAVVYARSVAENGLFEVHLVAAKTRVAPVKQVSIPRLELCGALLLSRLLKSVSSSLNVVPGRIFAFTDSRIVLAWLSSLPRKWNTFVANRTAEILESLPRSHWNHVRSQDNPADCASRGVEPKKLLHLDLWWKGPSWMAKDFSQWPAVAESHIEDVPEKKKQPITVLTSAASAPFLVDVESISSWSKLIRAVAYVHRFLHNCRAPPGTRIGSFLSFSELQAAKQSCLRWAQNEFYQEIKSLQTFGNVPSHSKLSSLSPFIDEVGLLRVGGRLAKAPGVPYNVKHPIILGGHNKVSYLILKESHARFLHAGVSELFSLVRQEFWILGSRNIIRRVVHDCLNCFRLRQATSKQLMGDLPKSRLSPSFPFDETGCDYAGPIMIRTSKLRKARLVKAYFAIFICMSTKALHLELVSDLSTAAFLAALKRFIARRGKCSTIYSDNGTNFLGASRALSEVYKLIRSKQHNELVTASLAGDNIKWAFIPPHSPHFGGLWEAGVKSVKQHLRRVVGNNLLTFEEICTLLAQIEALLNSRPLYAISDSDFNPLTPSHFLIGRPYTAIPEPSYLEKAPNRLNRWELVQNMVQGFWQKWQTDYVTSLQQRPKWMQICRDFKIGDLVVVKEPNLPPSKWALGRIEDIHPGQDGHVRVVTVRTQAGLFKRPITKLALLPGPEVSSGVAACSGLNAD